MNTIISELIHHGEISAKWLVMQVLPDGSLHNDNDDLGMYYKCIYPLRVAGYPHLASRMCDVVLEKFICQNADLHNKSGSKTSGKYTSEYCQIYPVGWVALGAFMTNRYEVFSRIMSGVDVLYFNDEVGSIRTKADTPNTLFDSNSAAMAIELYSLCDIKKAIQAAGFLEKLLLAQPDPENYFYSRMDNNGNVSTDLTTNPIYSAVDKHGIHQAYWFLGMPAAALLRLYMKTNEIKFLKLAMAYFDQATCLPSSLESPGSGKTMWAASILYRLTKDEKYLKIFTHIAECFFSWQRKDGLILPTWLEENSLTPKFNFDIVPEYIRWFYDTAAELAL